MKEYRWVEATAEEMLDAPPALNEVPDLMMETKDGRMIPEAATKRKRDEVGLGRRKRPREEDIRPEKCKHSPVVSLRTPNPAGFYSEDWDELQQEDHEWQVLDKWQRISQMLFCVWKYILMLQDVYQDPVLNTKEADVA